jgi:hypothetical protein
MWVWVSFLPRRSFLSTLTTNWKASDKGVFVGCAVVRLGYVVDVFLYVYLKQTNELIEHHETNLPWVFGDAFAENLYRPNSCTRSSSSTSSFLEFCTTSNGETFRVRAKLPRVELDVSLKVPERSFYMQFPLTDSGRDSRVVKLAGLPVSPRSVVSIDGSVTYDLAANGGAGAIDWTDSVARRVTQWNWASVASSRAVVQKFKVAKRSAVVGLNLSSRVYDVRPAHDANVGSFENVLFVDGRPIPLNRRVFFNVSEQDENLWKVTGDGLDLTFVAKGRRSDDRNLGLVVSQFVQPFGVFNGWVQVDAFTTVYFEDAFGVVEDHYAVW